MSRAIVCVSFGAYYEPYKKRLARSIKKFTPNVPFILFDAPKHNWLTHEEAPYAFKIDAMREVAKEHDHVLWLDAGAYITGPLDALWHHIEEDGHYLVRSDEQLLGDWISDEALTHFNSTRQDVWDKEWKLLCGMPYGFDFTNKKVIDFIDEWYDCAKRGLFREQRTHYRTEGSRVQGHRHDESIAGMLVHKYKMNIHPFRNLYHGDRERPSGGCIGSGYDNRGLWSIDIIDNHSVVMDALRPNKLILDAGARGFIFAKEMVHQGHCVVAIDPDPTIEDPHLDRVMFSHFALAAKTEYRQLEMFADPLARRLTQLKSQTSCETVRAISIKDLSCGRIWDLVKLNVEGEEYDILKNWPGPIARQIVVSFHQHTNHRRSEEEIATIVKHIGQWYRVVQHVKDERYCAGENYWDSVFLLHEIVP